MITFTLHTRKVIAARYRAQVQVRRHTLRVQSLLGCIFSDPTRVDAWLDAPNYLFEGRTGHQVIKDGEGRRIIRYLEAVLYG